VVYCEGRVVAPVDGSWRDERRLNPSDEIEDEELVELVWQALHSVELAAGE
jgi:hypothetical protein